MKLNSNHAQPEDQQKNEAKRLIETIMQMPDSDTKQSVQQLVLYLNQLLRIKVIVPPTTEIMIMLHGTKPKLYHATRYSLSASSHLQMLFKIHGDLELSIKRLDEFLN